MTTSRKNFSLFILFVFISTISWSCSTLSGLVGSTRASALITSTSPAVQVNGSATFRQTGNNITLTLEVIVPSMAGKSVAVHLHEHGSCGNMGNDAHGHWNPTNTSHGKWGSAQYHLGDIGNIMLDAAGRGQTTITTDQWSAGTGLANDIIGKSVIVHSGVDDYVTQPTGNAGGRIGCGVITAAARN